MCGGGGGGEGVSYIYYVLSIIYKIVLFGSFQKQKQKMREWVSERNIVMMDKMFLNQRPIMMCLAKEKKKKECPPLCPPTTVLEPD